MIFPTSAHPPPESSLVLHTSKSRSLVLLRGSYGCILTSKVCNHKEVVLICSFQGSSIIFNDVSLLITY